MGCQVIPNYLKLDRNFCWKSSYEYYDFDSTFIPILGLFDRQGEAKRKADEAWYLLKA